MNPTVRSPRGIGIVAAAVGILAALVLARRGQRSWGATDDEVEAVLPGDEILGPADLVATRSVSIQAPPEDVWPWLAQIGQDRGGFYSYDRLQGLLGLDIRNADDVVPDWQDVALGDIVRLAPHVGLRVAVVEPGEALVLHGAPGPGMDKDEVPMPFGFTWAFVLRRGPRGSTRLVVRERYTFLKHGARATVETVQIASFIMTERMLRGIKQRAEHRPPAEPVTV